MGDRVLAQHLSRRRLAATAVALCGLTAAPAAHAKPAGKLRKAGNGTVVSVDGTARLTVKSRGRMIKLRLFGVDTPDPGECGHAESVTALRELVAAVRGKVRYELLDQGEGRYERDAERRYVGWLSKPGEDWFGGSMSDGLIASEWGVGGTRLSATQGPVSHGEVQGSFTGQEPQGPRPVRGLWAKCGGRTHLPANEPVPSTSAAPWTISADGITQSIGALGLSAVLSPERALRVDQLAATTPVELLDLGDDRCLVRVPALQLLMEAATPSPRSPCGRADIFEIWSGGPGSVQTTSGAGVGSTAAALRAAFPRAVSGDDGDYALLTGPGPVPWAWQTIATLDDGGAKVTAFVTTTVGFDDN